MKNSFFNSVEFLQLIQRRKKELMIVGAGSTLLAIIFSSSLFIPPRFKSFAIIYPSNLIVYSTESTTEQMLQIAQSSDIRDQVIRNLDLYKHYGIDTLKNKQFRSEMINIFEDNVTIKKTEYESMEITAYDTDPKTACMIVDSMIHYFNLKARELQKEKSEEVMIIHRDQMLRKQIEMDSMEVLLKDLRQKYGILDYDKQSQEVIRGLFWNLASGNNNGTQEAKDMISSLKDMGGIFHATNEHLWRSRGTYNDLKVLYENSYRDVHKILTYTNVVTKPQIADKKSYPVRWLIVLVTLISSLLIAFILLVVMEARKFVSKADHESIT
ncbi:MAG: hypothetical protein ACKOKF_02440 [Bacteroidota bacterium]